MSSTDKEEYSKQLISTISSVDPDYYDMSVRNKVTHSVQPLIDSGADVNYQADDKDGETALMCAVKRNVGNVVDILLDNGADCHKQDKSNKTVINYIDTGNCDSIRMNSRITQAWNQQKQ